MKNAGARVANQSSGGAASGKFRPAMNWPIQRIPNAIAAQSQRTSRGSARRDGAPRRQECREPRSLSSPAFVSRACVAIVTTVSPTGLYLSSRGAVSPHCRRVMMAGRSARCARGRHLANRFDQREREPSHFWAILGAVSASTKRKCVHRLKCRNSLPRQGKMKSRSR